MHKFSLRPLYRETILSLLTYSPTHIQCSGDVSRTAQYFRLLKVARIVKTLRIIRIFKLAKHSTGLQALGNTMKANYKELGLLFLLLGMGAIMFASLIFVFEKEEVDTAFNTMFDSYWWAIITMTTVTNVELKISIIFA